MSEEGTFDLGGGWSIHRWICDQDKTGCCVGGGPHMIANPYHCKDKTHFYMTTFGPKGTRTGTCGCGAKREFSREELYGEVAG